MKNLSFLVLLSLAMVATSCGNKDESGGGAKFSSDPLKVSTVNGLINVDNYVVTAGGKTYQLQGQSLQIAYNAIVQASQQQPPIPLNGARQLKAKITGSLGYPGYNQQPGYPQQGYPQQYPQQGVANSLNVTQMIIYR